jgi:hypothetical protein
MCDPGERRDGPGAIPPVAILAALALTGCGTAGAKTAISKAQFVARADAICRAEQAKLAYIKRRAGAQSGVAVVPSLIRQKVAQSRLATARLESLHQPPGQAATIGRWLTARTVAATVASDVAEAPARKDATAVRDVVHELGKATVLEERLAGEYGLEVCDASE